MGKRIVHMEIDDRTFIDTEGLNRGLRELAVKAEDSCDFEGILNYAMQSLYRTQPGGQENYGGEEPRVGKVRLSSFNNREGPGKVNIQYTPPPPSDWPGSYSLLTIGEIDLRGRTYSVRGDEGYCRHYHSIPEILMRDTERVMESLGLNRKQKE